jgi:hypothetical protein
MRAVKFTINPTLTTAFEARSQGSLVEIGVIMMSNYPSFNDLLKLAQENPVALEKFRQEQVELIINRAPIKHQQRLRGLQFQIDAQRASHVNSPMGACLKISQMMHDSFNDLRAWIGDISACNDIFGHELSNDVHNRPHNAKIIKFTGTSN